MEPTTILIALALAVLPQVPVKPVPTAGDDFFTGLAPLDSKPAVRKDAAAWRREIARAQLLFEIDGKAAEARRDLARTWAELTKSEAFPGRGQVALELLGLDTRIPLPVGRPDAASDLFDPRSQGTLAGELAALATDARFVAARERFVRASQRRTGDPSADSADAGQIENAVLDALRAKNTSVLQELGVAAAPTFERLVREAPDEFKPVDEDPLVFLVRCAPERASVVCRDLLSQPGLGFLVAKRVMRAMSAQPPVLDPTSSAWRVTDETGTSWFERAPTLVVTGWRDVTTALLGIPVAASEALIFAQKLSQYDALDAPLRAALVEVARSDDESLHFALARSLNSRGLRPSVEPLLVELLDTPSAEVRAVAAEELARGPRSERLLAKFADPDPRVRASIANALEPVQLQRVRYSRGGHTFEYTTVERAFDERDRPLLDRLLADGSPDVRTAALQTASSAKIRLTPEIVERLSKDPDAAVRRAVVSLLPRLAKEAAPFLERALADTDAQVRAAAKIALCERYGIFQRPQVVTGLTEAVSRPVSEPPGSALRGLAIAQLVPGPEAVVADSLRWPLTNRLLADPEDARALVRAFLAAPPNPNIPAHALWLNLLSQERGDRGTLKFLDAEAVRALLVCVHSEQPEVGQVATSPLESAERTPAVQAGMSAFVADPAISRHWRLVFWKFVAREANAEDLLVAALTKPPFPPGGPDARELDAIKDLGRCDGANDALSSVLVRIFDADVPDAVIARLAWTAIQERDAPKELSKPLLDRLSKSTEPEYEPVLQWAVKSEAEQGRWETVRAALSDSRTRNVAIATIGRLRPPQGLAWLGTYLDDPALAGMSGASAAAAIAGYLSEDAAEILLRGAERAPNTEVRKACLDGVAEIRAFLDQKASWQQRSTGAQQRDAAVAELAAMLDSKDAAQRAEAARGLATLQGVEHLPRLVRMLQDPDTKVRAAVQESLGRLNAPR